MVVKVRDCNWEQFKNRFLAEEPAPYAIETLLAFDSDDLDSQMEDEQMRRVLPEYREWFERERQQFSGRCDQLGAGMARTCEHLQRIRINSTQIL